MKGQLRATIVMAFLACTSAHATTHLRVVQGSQTLIDQSYADDDADFYPTLNYPSFYLVYAGAPTWTLSAAGTAQDGLAPACYERATSMPIDRGRPRLHIALANAGCDTSVGRFKLLDLGIGSNDEITSLAIDFVEQCDQAQPPFIGKLRYRSDVTIDTPQMGPVFSTRGTLHFISEPGDFIGEGQEVTLDFDDALVRARTFGSAFYASELFMTDWTFAIEAPEGTPLTPGTYIEAEGYPIQSQGHPGLLFGYDHRGCNNTLDGQFSVSDFAIDPIDGIPTRMDAIFEQHCEHDGPALHGDFGLTTTFENGPFADEVLFNDHFDGHSEWPLVWACLAPAASTEHRLR